MTERMKNWYSGRVCFLDDVAVDFRAEIQFDEYYQGIITIYDVTREISISTKNGEYNSAVILLDNKEYISVFDLYVKKVTSSTQIVNGETGFSEGKMVIISSIILKGNKYFRKEDVFNQLVLKITDGVELLGISPYDFNGNYLDMIMYKDTNIPVQLSTISVNTIMGLEFSVFPKYDYSKDLFSIGFEHRITFKPIRGLKVMEIREVLNQMSSFFSLLCGKTITINKLSIAENVEIKTELTEFIGISNIVKEKLEIFDNSGLDSTSFKRSAVFKLSDFPDLEKAMNYWFEHYDALRNAQNAYERILLDEELKVITVNKYLAAMQLIEGYAQAYADEEEEVRAFEEHKEEILFKLTEKEDIELVEKGLGFSGISFRKAVKEYLYKGISCLEVISKTEFLNNNSDLIEKIINDRNVYTHSSNRATTQLEFNEMMDITTICKELYRILLLNEMEIPHSLLVQRFEHNSLSRDIFEKIFDVELCSQEELTEFDSAMWHFSDMK